ncbi:MAG: RidA family protein [Chloroflexi bacterium]|nr:RidA family protein [Chloroflexota bacterium]MBP6805520.1 RidA family protein [Chloroflexota bacterium]MBP7593404.1 RidA family protein [Chloroflexota bacterium]
MSKTSLNPDSLFNSLQFGFSQIVVAQGSRMVYFSGQVAWDKHQNIIGANDLRAQVWQSLRNVETAVTTAGGALADIVALRIYIIHDWMDRTAPVSEGLKAFFPSDHPPATTWIGVQSLARPEFLIEVEGTAVI